MSEPCFDSEGYPTEETLLVIGRWDGSWHELMAFVRQAWKYADDGYWTERSSRRGILYKIATGGWSGNESIIDALARNFIFWSLHWQLSKRGGGYEFFIPEVSKK